MLPVNLLVGTPLGVLCYEVVLVADDLAFEVGGQTGVVVRQACQISAVLLCNGFSRRTLNAQISTHERLAHVDMFDLDVYFVLLAVRGLATLESTAGPKERGRCDGEKLRRGQHAST